MRLVCLPAGLALASLVLSVPARDVSPSPPFISPIPEIGPMSLQIHFFLTLFRFTLVRELQNFVYLAFFEKNSRGGARGCLRRAKTGVLEHGFQIQIQKI